VGKNKIFRCLDCNGRRMGIMAIKADFAIINANELVTLKGTSNKPQIKEEMNKLGIIEDGTVAVNDQKIVAVGTTKEVLGKLEKGFKA